MPVIALKSAPCRISAECLHKALDYFKSIQINLVTLRAEEGCFDGYAEEIATLIRNKELAYSFSIDAGCLTHLTNQIGADAIAPAGITVRVRTKEEISACGLSDAVC